MSGEEKIEQIMSARTRSLEIRREPGSEEVRVVWTRTDGWRRVAPVAGIEEGLAWVLRTMDEEE